MSNYTWAKGYKYAKVPVFFKKWTLFGFTFTVQSLKTKRRREGAMVTKPKYWKKYIKLITSNE